MLFRGLQHERIKVSAKLINVNANERIPLYHVHENVETLDRIMGHHCAAASITTLNEPQG